MPPFPTPDPPPGGSFSNLISTILNGVSMLSKIQQALTSAVVVLPVSAYATGTWVPTLNFGGVTTGITYGTQSGTYTQVGREVTCRFRIVLTSKGAAAGAATITGLPLLANADATNNGSHGLCPVYANMSGLTGFPVLGVTPNSTTVGLFAFGAATDAALADTNLTNTSTLNGSFSYFV